MLTTEQSQCNRDLIKSIVQQSKVVQPLKIWALSISDVFRGAAKAIPSRTQEF
jgi:hypothetical protein